MVLVVIVLLIIQPSMQGTGYGSTMNNFYFPLPSTGHEENVQDLSRLRHWGVISMFHITKKFP